MSLGEFVFVAALAGIPILLLGWGWQRYLGIDANRAGKRQLSIALGLISVSTCAWLAVLALMILEDYSAAARSIAPRVSPAAVGLINLGLCAGALGYSRFGRRSAPELGSLRLAIGLNGGCLMVLWLFLASNPH